MEHPEFELRISLRSLAVMVIAVIAIVGGRTVYEAVQANHPWFWILVQTCVVFFGILVALTVAMQKHVKDDSQ